jgi:hypothetical protein
MLIPLLSKYAFHSASYKETPMKLKSDRQNIFILCCTFLIVVTVSCGNQSQSNKVNEAVQAKNNIQPVESETDAIRLKYTTGVRSILEDSKENTWFGSYNEGVCLLHNGELCSLSRP